MAPKNKRSNSSNNDNVKRGRGRPRKVKRGQGRPKKLQDAPPQHQQEPQQEQRVEPHIEVQQVGQDQEVKEIEVQLGRCDTALDLLCSVALLRLGSEVNPQMTLKNEAPYEESDSIVGEGRNETEETPSASVVSDAQGKKRKIINIGMYFVTLQYCYNL